MQSVDLVVIVLSDAVSASRRILRRSHGGVRQENQDYRPNPLFVRVIGLDFYRESMIMAKVLLFFSGSCSVRCSRVFVAIAHAVVLVLLVVVIVLVSVAVDLVVFFAEVLDVLLNRVWMEFVVTLVSDLE